MPDLTEFTIDLGENQLERSALVLDTLGVYDPIASFGRESAAYKLLYSGLDSRQRVIYEDLARHGLVP